MYLSLPELGRVGLCLSFESPLSSPVPSALAPWSTGELALSSKGELYPACLGVSYVHFMA